MSVDDKMWSSIAEESRRQYYRATHTRNCHLYSSKYLSCPENEFLFRDVIAVGENNGITTVVDLTQVEIEWGSPYTRFVRLL